MLEPRSRPAMPRSKPTAVEVLHRGGGGPAPPPCRGGGGPMPPLRRGGATPWRWGTRAATMPGRRRTRAAAALWRRRTHAVEEEEPAAMAPHNRRGSGGKRDAGAHGRQAIGELQQQRTIGGFLPLNCRDPWRAPVAARHWRATAATTLRDPTSSSLFFWRSYAME
jgi:hypothetical protein